MQLPKDDRDAKTLASLPDEALIDAVQRQTFRYFWDGADAASGMALDRRTDGGIPDGKVAIGGSGFGVMAMIVAVERGWITREAALERLRQIIDTLHRATRYHGTFSHFIDGTSGATIPMNRMDDAADLVETSFLIMGLLCVRQYFSEDTEPVRRLRRDIDQLWHGVDWQWFTQGGRDVLYWHWSPNNGWAMNHEIRGWNECLVTYLLAVASPTHPVDPQVYHRGFASGEGFVNGKSYYGIEMPLGMPYGGPLFFTHYSFCGIDPRGLSDRYGDYWELNSRHVQINRAHCIANPKGHKGYGESCWGLTASDDPDVGYLAHAPDVDNGTITPTAALASLPYAPTEVMQVLRYFLNTYGERIWREYGFVDAFCDQKGWIAETFLAIDQGPIVVIMENYRTGLLWKLFMAVPEVQAGLRALDFRSPHLAASAASSSPGLPKESRRGPPATDFESWVDAQVRRSAKGMLDSISPLAIVKQRPGFGQTMQPVAGAIVASPVLADWDPDPDYFFHWFRDSALVIDALRSLYADQLVGDEALQHLRDFTRFSLGLTRLDGRVDAAVPDRHARLSPEFLQFARDDAELARAHGDAVAGESRVNPDGTLDISRWARPQHDGPPLRALAMLRCVAEGSLTAPLLDEAAELIRFDLDFTLRHARKPSYDIWEEEVGHHYYTLRVSAAALAEGAAWLAGRGDLLEAQRCQEESQAILGLLDGYWLEGDDDAPGYYRSRMRPDGQFGSAKSLDIAVILSAIHAPATPAAVHGVADPRTQATLKRLEALFDAAYPINQGRAPGHGPAMGRYEGDVYHSGGAWYLSTLGAAEFCFRAAMSGIGAAGTATAATTTVDASGHDARQAHDWFARGNAYLATVRAYTPASGDLSEQFDQRTGEQTSAKHLAWSYAAFISCARARRTAAAAIGAAPRR